MKRSLMPDLAVLRAFECAARHENFTRAALELNSTQSAVSRQIRSLEVQLGVPLFERIRKRVVLSEAGRGILPTVSRLLAQTEEMVFRASAVSNGERFLSIATLPTFGNRWLIPRLAGFLRKNPGTVLNIGSRSEPFEFASEDFDVAIHYGKPVWPHATCSYLCSEIIVPVASQALLDIHPVRTARDLQNANLLHLTTRLQSWTEWFAANECEDISAYRGNRFDQFNMIIEAAIAGIGFALLPKYLVESELASGQLVVPVDSTMQTENSYYLVVPEGRQLTSTTQAFNSWILGEVSESSQRPTNESL